MSDNSLRVPYNKQVSVILTPSSATYTLLLSGLTQKGYKSIFINNTSTVPIYVAFADVGASAPANENNSLYVPATTSIIFDDISILDRIYGRAVSTTSSTPVYIGVY